MARTPTTDRNNVTAEDSPVIAMRLTPREATVLDVLVRQQNEQAEAMGIAAAVTRASAMRALLRQAAKAKGLWDDDNAGPAQPKAITAADVLEAAKALTDKRMGLTFVPAIVRSFEGRPAAEVIAAVKAAADAGMLELRPESGMGRLSKPDAMMCPPGPQGTVLSWARVIEAVDASKLAKRIERAVDGKAKRFDSQAELAREADVTPNDVSKAKRGEHIPQDKLARLAAALSAKGL